MEKIDLKSVKIALNRDEMEEVVGGCRPPCSYEYAGFLAAASSLAGPWGIFIFGGGMLYCR